MNLPRVLERLDGPARHVLDVAWEEAARLGDGAVGTEHLLMALAVADATTAQLLTDAGATTTDLRHALVRGWSPGRRPEQQALLSTLGVDLTEVRRRAEQTFGAETVARAASEVQPRPPRRPLRTWISCSRPLPSRSWDSPLSGPRLAPIPRVTRLLKRATRAARPQLASSGHLLLALLEGNEPACEVLGERGVDLRALTEATRRELMTLNRA